MATLQTLILSFFISLGVSAQIDSTKFFESSKGQWKVPINRGTQLLNSSGGFIHDHATFVGTKDSHVSAVFDGRIISIDKKGKNYILITEFGQYTITYVNLANLKVKKNDFIKSGQLIGELSEDEDGMFTIKIYLDKGDLRIDPNRWFSY